MNTNNTLTVTKYFKGLGKAYTLGSKYLEAYIDFIYRYTFFEMTKFSKILSKLTFFSKNFKNFVIFRKYCMPQTVWTFDFKPKRFKRIG